MNTTLFAVAVPGGINRSNVTTDTWPRHEHFKDRSWCAPRDVAAGHM